MRVGVDLMGSDSSPQVLFQAVIEVAKELDATDRLVAIVTAETLTACRQICSSIPITIEFIIADDAVLMSDAPLTAVRRKKRSSMMLGIQQLRDKQLDAFVSAGNTGALIAGTTLTLPKLPDTDRSALLALLPTEKGPVAVLDVGGNIACKPHHLVQFAHLGAAYQLCAQGTTRPRIGLLNIGVEASKGTTDLREVHDVLQKHFSDSEDISFVGNVEGREVYQGAVDVLVTDGFTGNIFLKASEGVSSFILEHLQAAFALNTSEEVHKVLGDLQHHVDYAEYPGAIVCGVDGVVVKCHGNSCQQAMKNGIKGAIRLVENNLVDELKSRLRQGCGLTKRCS